MTQAAILALADGSIFHGQAIGQTGYAVGEVIFNTAMMGYQEILTDPSYAQQIITFTYPHIGNVGVNQEDTESNQIVASGLVIRDLSPITSNWRSEKSLADYLYEQNVIGIASIDTRRLTKILRDKGAQNGCIMAGEVNIEQALDYAQSFPGLSGLDLAKEVTTKESYQWPAEPNIHKSQFHVVAYDFGIKTNILRLLAEHSSASSSCRITVVPAQTSAADVLALQPDGVFLSNGPGDPAACEYAIASTKVLLEANIPLFGICLGFQILALASGASTIKMKFGHHGANHPILDLVNNKVLISSQNHGFAVDENSLPTHLNITHRSLFDNSIQGIAHADKPAFGLQGHPEASPGPHDIINLFNRFIQLMEEHAKT